jgi:hypothetical protein
MAVLDFRWRPAWKLLEQGNRRMKGLLYQSTGAISRQSFFARYRLYLIKRKL